MFSFKPDYEKSKARIDAFWDHEILDRPVVQIPLYKPADERMELPLSKQSSPEEKWLDIDYQVEWNLINLSNQLFLGDSMPVAWPNLGPNVFAAFYDFPLKFGENETNWSEPNIEEPIQGTEFVFNWGNPYLHKTTQITESLLEIGKGKFITGMPDWHIGGDCLALLRGSKGLAADLITGPYQVKELLIQIDNDYRCVYEMFYKKLRDAEQPISTWVPLVSDEKFNIVSNDFSIMIGARMYREIFLDGIIRECQFLDRSIYHLDGPGALRHLDALLEITDLDGVQFVPSPWDDNFVRWAQVYKRIQAADKCVQVNCNLSEIKDITRILKPEGLYLVVRDVSCEQDATALIRQLERWCLKNHPTG